MIRNASEIFDFRRYPAGEPHINISTNVQELDDGASAMIGTTSTIIWNARNFDDLALMVTGWKTLQRKFGQDKKFIVPYFPFGRHDRRVDSWDGDPLHMALDIVRPMMNANCLLTIDPHSDVSGVIPHITQRSVVKAFLSISNEVGYDIRGTLIPDNGATKRAAQWLDLFDLEKFGIYQGHKTRDVYTGKITNFSIDPFAPFGNWNLLIVDDICDGGGTFLGLLGNTGPGSERDGNPKPILLTTHGLYPKGVEHLLQEFDLWTLDVHENPDNVGVNYLDTKILIADAIREGAIQ